MAARIVDGEARDRLIIWIRKRMEALGITIEALARSIEHDRKHPPVYRDAHGNEWNGEGEMPDWLRAARNAGVDADFFRIAPRREVGDVKKARPDVDGHGYRQPDLFD